MPRPRAVNVNKRIAGNVRARRAGAGLSLAALAARSGVSRSMLSLIERGEISPTAVVLDKIATGLSVVLATLFDEPDAAVDPVARASLRTPWRDPESGYVRRNISPSNFPSPIQIVDVLLPAGARVAYETGARNADIHQQIWVREGQLTVSVGDRVHALFADDCLAMRLDVPTAFHNRTRNAARYVVAIVTREARRPAA